MDTSTSSSSQRGNEGMRDESEGADETSYSKLAEEMQEKLEEMPKKNEVLERRLRRRAMRVRDVSRRARKAQEKCEDSNVDWKEACKRMEERFKAFKELFTTLGADPTHRFAALSISSPPRHSTRRRMGHPY